MRFYTLEYHPLEITEDVVNEKNKLITTITENNSSIIRIGTSQSIYCIDLEQDEYAIGFKEHLRFVVKREDVSDEYIDIIMPLYRNGWINFHIMDMDTNKLTELNDRFALALLTTPRKSNIIFLSHYGYNRIGKVENKFLLNIVRNGSYNIKVSPSPIRDTIYWYTLRIPLISYKNEIHVLNNILQAIKYMYTTKRVLYNNTGGIYNGLLDPYSFSIGFEEPHAMLKMIIILGKDHKHFNAVYDQVKKMAESAIKDDIELLYKIATIYDIYIFITSIYNEYNDSFSIIMKEYLDAVFKNRIPDKSPIEITIIDFESKYKKKIED